MEESGLIAWLKVKGFFKPYNFILKLLNKTYDL